MKSLKFKQLLVLSNSTRSANRFEFSRNLNLIKAEDNSVGKSTLLKLLFWGLGCEPVLDTTWNAQDCKTIVDFEIDSDVYRVHRYKNQIAIKENDLDYVEYNKVTGEYSKKFAEIVNFKALLPNSSGIVETPPPAFYFLPFYIDQKKSWGNAWDNFSNLGQYQKWKNTIIKYHVGQLTPAHFEIESEKSDKKENQKNLQIEVSKIDTAIELVETFIPKTIQTVTSIKEINRITDDIKEDLKKLQQTQEKLLDELSIYTTDKTYLYQQQVMTEKLIAELDKDYLFTVEYIAEEEIECPLCGTVHENSLINRASILTDKVQAENQLKTIVEDIKKLDAKVDKNSKDLEFARKQIEEINKKYIIEEHVDEEINFNKIIESIASKNIIETVTHSKINKESEISQIDKDVKELNKDQKALISKEEIEDINNSFKTILTKYIKQLDAEAVNLSEINSPLDFNKVIREGGAAEGARAILAYYLTIFTMVKIHGNEVVSPLVVDTPNQQEQSHTNYDKIVALLTNEFSDDTQVIMSAMDNDQLKPFADKAKIITLNKNDKLLLKSKYESIKTEFE